MFYPKLNELKSTIESVDVFRGYNRNLRIGEGEFREMTNLSSDLYPMLSPRKGRATALNVFGDTTGVIMKDVLCYTCGGAFYHGDNRYDMGLDNRPKQLVSMGAYVLIFPDKKYINTADPSDRGDIEAEHNTYGTDTVNIFICRPDGKEYTTEYVSETEPDSPRDKAVWVNTSEYPNTLHQWNEAACCWVKLTTSTIKLFSMGIGKKFKAGDGITISGIKAAETIYNMSTREPITEKQREQLEALEGSHVILECSDNEIVINGIMDAQCSISSAITIKRSVPEMDFVVEHNNRLWGCRYGQDAAGEFVNILYASKLGDFRNWNCYQGVDTDSYYANVGSDGPFTGAISYGYGNCVLFFKEGGIHAVYGDGPSEFRVEFTACRGVQQGSGKSVAIVDGVVYYKSTTGVCAYAGALPKEIGGAFAGEMFHGAAGGSWRHKYYLSMADQDGKYSLFAYDTRLGMWHREDAVQVADWADCGNNAWLVTGYGSRVSMDGSGGIKEFQIPWSAQTGILGTERTDRKRLNRINIRLRLEAGAKFRLLVRYDSNGGWKQLCSMVSSRLKSYDFPVKVCCCDHLELRMEGVGHCEIYSIVKTYEMGGDCV